MPTIALPPPAPSLPPHHRNPAKQPTTTRGHVGGVLGFGSVAVILLAGTVLRSPIRELSMPIDPTRPSYMNDHSEDMKQLAKLNDWLRPSNTGPAAAKAARETCPLLSLPQPYPTAHSKVQAVPFQVQLMGSTAAAAGGKQPMHRASEAAGAGGRSASAQSQTGGTVTCMVCNALKSFGEFSPTQNRKAISSRKCRKCIESGAAARFESAPSEEDTIKTELANEHKVQKIFTSMSCGVPTGVLYPKDEGNPFSNRMRSSQPPSDVDRAAGKAGLKDYQNCHDLDKPHGEWVKQCRALLSDGGKQLQHFTCDEALTQLDRAEANLEKLPRHVSHCMCSCGIDHRRHVVEGCYFYSTLGLRTEGESNVCRVKSKFAERLDGGAHHDDVLGLKEAIEAGHLPQHPTAMCTNRSPKVEICSMPAKDVLLDGSRGCWVPDANGAVCVLLAPEKVSEKGLKLLENSLYMGAVAGGAKLLTRGDSVAAIGTMFLKWGLKEERTLGLLCPHSLPITRPVEQRAAGASTGESVKLSSADRLFLMEKQKEMRAFYGKFVHPIVEQYMFAEFASVGLYMSRKQMALFICQVTAATSGELFWALTHIDDDVFFSVLVKHATPLHPKDTKNHPDVPVRECDEGGDFALPNRGIVVPLERGNVLVYNPRKYHAATEHGALRHPTSRGCMTAFYVKASCIRAWFTSRSYVQRIGLPTLEAAHHRAMEAEYPHLRAPGVPGKRKLEEEAATRGRDESSGKTLRESKKTMRYEA